MDYLKEELEQSRKIMGISQEEIAKIMGINSKTYRARLQDENSFNIDEIRKYVLYLEKNRINIEEYPTLQIFGTMTNLTRRVFDKQLEEISKMDTELFSEFGYNKDFFSKTVSAIKLSPHVSAGNGSNIESIDSVEKMGEFVLDICTFKTPPPKRIFAMQVDGYSMIPMVFPDSWVVFDDSTCFKGDGMYVINWRNVLMVKLLQVNSDGMLRIVSANKDYESYTVEPDDQSVFRIFGKVLRTII